MEKDELEDQIYELNFVVQKWRRYHQHRQRIYDNWNKVIKAFFVLSGSAVINEIPNWIAVFAPAFVLLDTIFSVSGKATKHKIMYNAFSDLETEINTIEHTEQEYKRWVEKRRSIERDASPPYKALEAYCHNEVGRVWGVNKEYLIEISRLERRSMNFCHHNGLGNTNK